MPRQSLDFRIRIPVGHTVQDLMDLAAALKELRSMAGPIQWAAIERLGVAIAAEAAVDRQSACLLVNLQHGPHKAP